jgi:plasmid stabilization system protein ParE
MPDEFHPLARAELRKEVQFYASRARGLARSLRDEMQTVLDLLADVPLAGQEQRTGVRGLPMRRFPFTVFCRAEATRGYVLAVAHQRREPGYWLERLEE